jgi:DnaJ like chaperone protein
MTRPGIFALLSKQGQERMQWQGKIIGALVGALAGPAGALLGGVLGHAYDLAREGPAEDAPDTRRISDALFTTAFAVMGHLAKADGRVSETEIEAARLVMRQLQLQGAQVQAAIDCYGRGKQPDYPIAQEIERLRIVCGPRHDLLRFFMELEFRAALMGNDLAPPVRQRLIAIGGVLGFSGLELAGLEAVMRMQTGRMGRGPGAPPPPEPGASLRAAYEVLGIQASASDEEVKKAYRRQMNENHPDKLMARGLPESMQELAKEKTQRIREAYEAILAERSR